MTKVLIVDDNIDLLKLIELKLTQEGYDVSVAEDGFKGLRKSIEKEPDIIILDIMMPEMDGWEFLERIRERSNVPVLMLTAKSEDQDVIRGLNMGADEYLTKPFRLNTLSARLEALLRRRKWEEGAVITDVEALKKSITNAISHELRIPVALILNALDLALRDAFLNDPDAQREFIQEARQNAMTLRWLVDDLLMLIRIDQGLEIFRRPILVHPQIKHLVETMDEKASEKDLRIRFSCPEDLSINVDQLLFRQALHHLLNQTISRSPDGGKVLIAAQRVEDGMVDFNFHNDGPRIAESVKAKIFERFYQSENQVEKKYESLGVGLSISREIARAHGGDITVRENAGEEGSFLSMSLPLGLKNPA